MSNLAILPFPKARTKIVDANADDSPRLYLTVTIGSDLVALTRSQCEEILEQIQRYIPLDELVANEPVMSPQTDERGQYLGYTDEGDLAEWIPDDEAPGGVWPLTRLRNRDEIGDFWSECWDKVWWNRRQDQLEDGEPLSAEAQAKVEEIEEYYGRENLGWDNFEFGLLCGKMSALGWVLGLEWEASLDT